MFFVCAGFMWVWDVWLTSTFRAGALWSSQTPLKGVPHIIGVELRVQKKSTVVEVIGDHGEGGDRLISGRVACRARDGKGGSCAYVLLDDSR